MSRCMMPCDLPRALGRHRATRLAGRMSDATTADALRQGAGAVSGGTMVRKVRHELRFH